MSTILTTASGAPVADNQNSRTAGPRGPLLLDDFHLIEKLAHFNRENIPERPSETQARANAPQPVVAEKGIGRRGSHQSLMYFENAAVHAALPVAGGRGKDTGLNEMFKMLCGFAQSPCADIRRRQPRDDDVINSRL